MTRESEQIKVAISALDLARRGDFAAVLAMFAAPQQRRLTPEAINAAWQTHVVRYGAVWSLEPSGIHSDSGMDVVTVVMNTKAMALKADVSIDRKGRLLNLQVTPLAPPWTTCMPICWRMGPKVWRVLLENPDMVMGVSMGTMN